MARVKRANVVLTIADDEINNYLDRGYDIISDSGEVIKEAIPTDIHTLQKAYLDSKIQIANLEKGIADLRKELEKVNKEKRTRR